MHRSVQVAPNPELRGFTVTGANMLPQVRLQQAAACFDLQTWLLAPLQ